MNTKAVPARPLRSLGMILLLWCTARMVMWTSFPIEATDAFPLRAAPPVTRLAGRPMSPMPSFPLSSDLEAGVAPGLQGTFQGQDREAPPPNGSANPPPHAAAFRTVPAPPVMRPPITLRSSRKEGGYEYGSPPAPSPPHAYGLGLAPGNRETVWRAPIWRRGHGLRRVSKIPAPAKRWSLSVWALARSEGAGGPDGNGAALGNSQAGARISYRLSRNGLAATVRTSTALTGASSVEIAPGLMWRYKNVGLIVEHRQNLSTGGRTAFALTGFAGLYRDHLPGRLRAALDLQAGLVGVNRRDGFIEGQIRLARSVARIRGWDVAAGLAGSGAIQPRLKRMDLGPMIALRAPEKAPGLRLEGGWRFRLGGNARPGSGPAIVIGYDR